MADQLSPELESFIRWLATNPHKLRQYEIDPRGFLDVAQVGAEARAALEAAGPQRVRRAVEAKAEEIHSAQDIDLDNPYGRDTKATGFGAKPS
jgi:hypothetical protein